MLTDSQRRFLTGYIGECWHRYERGFLWCMLCESTTENRTFLTWADLGAIKEAIEKAGKWDSFSFYAWHKWWNPDDLDDDPESSVKEMRLDFTPWLFNPVRFCQLAAEWLERREK